MKTLLLLLTLAVATGTREQTLPMPPAPVGQKCHVRITFRKACERVANDHYRCDDVHVERECESLVREQ